MVKYKIFLKKKKKKKKDLTIIFMERVETRKKTD